MDSRMEEVKISLDALVPKNYLVRKIDKSLSFNYIYPIVESTYTTIGRPSKISIHSIFILDLFDASDH